jgi:hypothetical protein
LDFHSLSETLLLSQESFPGCDVISAASLPARGVEEQDLGNFLITSDTFQFVSYFAAARVFLERNKRLEANIHLSGGI